jgi:hypothetical protein
MKLLDGSVEIIDREMYDYYRQKRKKVAKEIDQYKLWLKAVHGILRTLKEMVAENENGVYLEGFGYIYIEKFSEYKKRISILKKEIKIRNKVRFELDDENLREKFSFTPDNIRYWVDNTKDYEPNLEAVKYLINVKKLKWNT